MDVQALMQIAGASPSATALRSGVSRSTLKRIRDRTVTPSLTSLREIALSLGYDIDLQVREASDPGAATAARALLDEAVDALRLESRPNVAEWIQRYARWGCDTPQDLVRTAGRYSAPQLRPGATFFMPPPADGPGWVEMVASAGVASRSDWALSGAPAGAFLTGERVPGPLVIWAQDAGATSSLLATSLRRADRFQPAGVVVTPVGGTELVDRFNVGRVQYVAPIQAVIDLHGLGLAGTADRITEGW